MQGIENGHLGEQLPHILGIVLLSVLDYFGSSIFVVQLLCLIHGWLSLLFASLQLLGLGTY